MASNDSQDPVHPQPEPTKQPITPAQAAARRANGARSRGPRSELGKHRSRANALKHGAYARTIGVIEHGPLAEDVEEAEAFFDDVITWLQPLTPLDEILAKNAAAKLWREFQLHHYMAIVAGEAESPETWMAVRKAELFERAAELLGRLDEALNAEDVRTIALGLSDHPLVKGQPLFERDEDQVELRRVVGDMLARCHDSSIEVAQSWLRGMADSQASEIAPHDERERKRLIREHFLGKDGEKLRRAETHISTEAARSLRRYWEQRGRLQPHQDGDAVPDSN